MKKFTLFEQTESITSTDTIMKTPTTDEVYKWLNDNGIGTGTNLTARSCAEVIRMYVSQFTKPTVTDEDTWISIKDKLPEPGFEVLLFNKKWINEDFNPKGIRIGFKDDVGGWISAYWCNYHDDYHTRISEEDDKSFTDFKGKNQIPTHWMEIKAMHNGNK